MDAPARQRPCQAVLGGVRGYQFKLVSPKKPAPPLNGQGGIIHAPGGHCCATVAAIPTQRQLRVNAGLSPRFLPVAIQASGPAPMPQPFLGLAWPLLFAIPMLDAQHASDMQGVPSASPAGPRTRRYAIDADRHDGNRWRHAISQDEPEGHAHALESLRPIRLDVTILNSFGAGYDLGEPLPLDGGSDHVRGVGVVMPPSSRLPATDCGRTILKVPKHALDLLQGAAEVFGDLSRQHVRVR